jgi:hypothetical protein
LTNASSDGEALKTRPARVAHRKRLDTLIAVMLFGVVYFWCTAYVRDALAAGLKPDFYQAHFAPAVMMACGRGYASPVAGVVPELDSFLALERDSFTCVDLPANPQLGRLTAGQVTWRYLISTAGLVWRLRGVSWATLVTTLGAIFFAATVALAYGLARLVAGRILALGVAGTVLTSPLHLSIVPHLRDYSKAPFMIALWILLGAIVAAPLRTRRVLALAAAYGLVLAVGSGFRNDVLIGGPPFLAALAFLPGGASRNAALKLKAIAIAAAAFLVLAWPLIGAYALGGGASMQHNALLGLARPFDTSLNVEPGPYEFVHGYDDEFVATAVTNYAARRHHIVQPITDYDRRYDAAASNLIWDIVTTFPADIITRAYASVIIVATLPSSNYLDRYWPPFLRPDSIAERFYKQRARLLQAAPWIWPGAVIMAVLLASTLSLRIAGYVALVGLYFAAYAAVQFAPRHYFQLDVIGAVALAFVLHRITVMIPSLAAGQRQRAADVRRATARIVTFAVGALLVLGVPLALARAYQDRHVTTEIKRRLGAPRQPLHIVERQERGRTVLDVADAPADLEAVRWPGTTRAEYLVVQLGGPHCQSNPVPVRFRYDRPFEESFTRTRLFGLSAGEPRSTILLTPVFFRAGQGGQSLRFRGLEVLPGDESCIEFLSRIADPGQFGVLFDAVLPADWRSRPLHQGIAVLEPARVSREPTFITVPRRLPLSRRQLTGALVVPETMFRDEIVRQTAPGAWMMNGEGRAPFSYLLQFRPVLLETDARLIVQGVLHAGGLIIGILRSNRWVAQAQILEPGPFLTVLATESPGPASLVVANNLQGASLKNVFEISRAGLLLNDNAPE